MTKFARSIVIPTTARMTILVPTESILCTTISFTAFRSLSISLPAVTFTLVLALALSTTVSFTLGLGVRVRGRIKVEMFLARLVWIVAFR